MNETNGIHSEQVQTAMEKMQETDASTPSLKENEDFIRNTRSICPKCYRVLPAIIFERNEKIWIRKECPEHGKVEALYWGNSDMYYRAMDFQIPGRDVTGVNVQEMNAPCPLNCGYCPEHKNQTALANITVTNRCDLSCSYCFFYAKKLGYVYEPSIQEIREMIRNLREQGPFTPNAVQLTGGEPLIRENLQEVVKAIKEEGIKHVQLNTNGIKFAQLLYNKGVDSAVEYARSLREAGVNTLYLSFDGVTPQTNPKNHYEIPYDLHTFRLSGLNSIVLVPVISKGKNDKEVGDIIKFACQNRDIIKGVDFQPISFVGSKPREKRQEERITIPDVIIEIEEQTNGEIPREAWFPITWPFEFSKFIEHITGEPTVNFTNHPACGMATYIFPQTRMKNGKRIVEGYTPITDFVDVRGLWEYLIEKNNELENGANRWIVSAKILANLVARFVDQSKAPEGVDMRLLLGNLLLRRSYDAMGEIQEKAMFLGMMHFQDLYNYDIERVERCCISYLSQDGRILPFCAYNVLPDIYKDKIIKKYGESFEEWEKEHPGTVGTAIKYQRDIQKLKNTKLYRKTYDGFL